MQTRAYGFGLTVGVTLLAIAYLLLPGNDVFVINASEALGDCSNGRLRARRAVCDPGRGVVLGVDPLFSCLFEEGASYIGGALSDFRGVYELLQRLVPERGSTIWDFMTKLVGALMFVFWLWGRKRRGSDRAHPATPTAIPTPKS